MQSETFGVEEVQKGVEAVCARVWSVRTPQRAVQFLNRSARAELKSSFSFLVGGDKRNKAVLWHLSILFGFYERKGVLFAGNWCAIELFSFP